MKLAKVTVALLLGAGTVAADALSPQQEDIKVCREEASGLRGRERQAVMMECLSAKRERSAQRVFTPGTVASAPPTDPRPSLSGASTLRELFPGNTVYGGFVKGSMKLTKYFASDGTTVERTASTNGRGGEREHFTLGTWSIQGDKLCTGFKGQRQACFGIARQSDGAFVDIAASGTQHRRYVRAVPGDVEGLRGRQQQYQAQLERRNKQLGAIAGIVALGVLNSSPGGGGGGNNSADDAWRASQQTRSKPAPPIDGLGCKGGAGPGQC